MFEEHAATNYKIQCIFYSFILILCICLCLWTVYHIQIHLNSSDNKKIPVRSISFSILGMTGFILNIIFQIVYLIITINVFDHNEDPYHMLVTQIPNALSYAFLFGGQTCIQLLFIYRLVMIFENTQYEISYKTILLFYMLSITFFINCILVCVTHLLLHCQLISWKIGEILYAIFFISAAILDFVISATMLYLFVNRLFKVVLIVDDNEWNDNKTQKKVLPILNMITRYFVLTVYSIGAVQIYLILAGILHLHAIFDSNYHSQILLMVFYYFYPIQSLIAVYCCAANFIFAEKLYHLCCGQCHKCCVRQWMSKARRQMNVKNNVYMLMVHNK
eukprot:98411_1